MTVEETLRFAFDSMAGGTHLGNLDGKDLNLTDEQKDLVAWMDAKHFKVMAACFCGGHNSQDPRWTPNRTSPYMFYYPQCGSAYYVPLPCSRGVSRSSRQPTHIWHFFFGESTG